jgi:cobalt-zinc-cadmium efflux system membrane fusion protein
MIPRDSTVHSTDGARGAGVAIGHAPPGAAGAEPRHPRLVGVLVALSLSALAVFAASRFERKPPPPEPPPGPVTASGSTVTIAKGAPQWDVIGLGEAVPATERWTDPVPGYVRVDETRAARVGAPLGGRVTQVFAELGQTVKVGAPLFSVSSPDLSAIRAERDRARVELEAAHRTYERVRAIVEARALPEKEEILAKEQLRQAELSSLKVASRGYGEFVVRSPREGRVAEKSVLPGQEIDAGAQGNLMMIADLSSVWVVADLFESDSAGVVPGTKTKITVPSLPGRSFEGAVETVSAVVDPERHSIPIRVRLDNRDGALRPNTFARIQFHTSAVPGSVEIAASALVTDGAKQYVYVRGEGGRFSRRAVTAEGSREGRVVVTEGLSPGDVVVERGALLLDNQMKLAE